MIEGLPANIGLQRTSACGLAAELGSFGEEAARWASVIVALAVVLAPMPMEAQTPWERYVQNPTAKNADAVTTLAYSTGRLDEDELCADLDVLESEVIAQDRSAVRLAFRIRVPGHCGEEICVMLGRLIRPNPSMFLEELKAADVQDTGCIVGNFGSGFIDRDQAQHFEAESRIKALRRITDPSLRATRDACIRTLKGK